MSSYYDKPWYAHSNKDGYTYESLYSLNGPALIERADTKVMFYNQVNCNSCTHMEAEGILHTFEEVNMPNLGCVWSGVGNTFLNRDRVAEAFLATGYFSMFKLAELGMASWWEVTFIFSGDNILKEGILTWPNCD